MHFWHFPPNCHAGSDIGTGMYDKTGLYSYHAASLLTDLSRHKGWGHSGLKHRFNINI